MHKNVPGIAEIYVWLCSQIGQPIDRPLVASAQLVLKPGASLSDVRKPVEEVIERELADIQSFTRRLINGELSVC